MVYLLKSESLFQKRQNTGSWSVSLLLDFLQERRSEPAGGSERRTSCWHRGAPAGSLQGLPGAQETRPEEAAGPRREMHPEEREEIYVCEGLALVETAGARDAAAERAQNRGGTQGENGECLERFQLSRIKVSMCQYLHFNSVSSFPRGTVSIYSFDLFANTSLTFALFSFLHKHTLISLFRKKT